MNILRKYSNSPGFALPTVLIASVVMLAVLTASVAAAASTRSALQTEYYNQLARDAADSGLAMAKACIAAGTSTWANPLRPGGDCSGLAAQCSTASCYVVQSGDTRTTFAVSTPSIAGNVNTVTVTGTLEQTRTSNGTVWRSYTQTLRKQTVTSGSASPTSAVLGAWTQLSSGGSHTCSIAADSQVYCWGLNTNGRLGDGSTTQRTMPAAVGQGALPSGATILAVSSGASHTCAIASDSKAYCWGLNTNGQLGNNSTTQSTTPVAVAQGAIPVGATILKITSGTSYTCVIASDNNAYCWGLNTNGQLGNNSTTQSLVPVAVSQGAIPGGVTLSQITAGSSHTCAIASNNNDYCWGNNTNGQLGDNSTTQRLTPVAVAQGAKPVGSTISKISAGTSFTCAVASDAKAYCWGLNTNGQLGDNSTTQRLTPVAVAQGAMSVGTTVSLVNAGTSHACAATSSGIYCWGLNTNGQLGNNSTTQSLVPVAVSQGMMPAGTTAASISAGASHTCAIASDSKTYCWGNNANGRLGDNSTTQRLTAVSVVSVRQLVAGANHTCALAFNNKAYCWGLNTNGQLGDNSTTQRLTPVEVAQGDIPTGVTISKLTAGANHTCAIASDGEAYCWGLNTNGQLGDNSTTQRLTPVLVAQGAVPAGYALSQIGAGASHTCALSLGEAYCWGLNTNGQLGDNSTTQRLTPVLVDQGAINVTALIFAMTVGANHACVFDDTAAAYCWGLNSSGQLGNNSTTQSLVPAAISRGAMPNGYTVVSLYSGSNHTCARTGASDSKTYCWGSNANGQLGDNSTTQRNTAVLVAQGAIPVGQSPGLSNVTGGASHTCTIASDSWMYCWGLNSNGQLGDSSTTQRLTPVAVAQGGMPAGSTIVRMTTDSSSASHVCALASDSLIYCWGKNTNGQLGDNSTTQRTSPTSMSAFMITVPGGSPAVVGTYYF